MSTGVVYNSNPVQVQNAQIGGSSSPVPAGQWTSGLFECCHPGCGTCCFACCCTSCLLGQVSDLMHSDDYCCAGGYFGACCCHFMLGGGFTLATMLMTGVYVPAFGVCVSCPLRAGVRNKYNIDGNAFLDCCIACWCEPCSAEQASKELKKRGSLPTQGLVAIHPAPAPVTIQHAVVVGQPGQQHGGSWAPQQKAYPTLTPAQQQQQQQQHGRLQPIMQPGQQMMQPGQQTMQPGYPPSQPYQPGQQIMQPGYPQPQQYQQGQQVMQPSFPPPQQYQQQPQCRNCHKVQEPGVAFCEGCGASQQN